MAYAGKRHKPALQENAEDSDSLEEKKKH